MKIETLTDREAALWLLQAGHLDTAIEVLNLCEDRREEMRRDTMACEYARVRRLHYRASPGERPPCGTHSKVIRVTGIEPAVTCAGCISAMKRRRRDGILDLLGRVA